MSLLIDLLVLLLVGGGIYAEVRRGLFFAIADVVRIVCSIGAGLVTYSVIHELTQSYAAGFAGFAVVALLVIGLFPVAFRLVKADPAWGRTALGRIGAGGIGLGIGLLSAAVLVPVIGRGSTGARALPRSALGRPFVRTMPAFYYLADELDLDLPMLRVQASPLEEQSFARRAALVERINYSRLDGSTCIRCRARAHFDGYFVRIGISVSPRFHCLECGRTSDGCQTFEGFHKMYGRCPVVVCTALGPIDCGVWPNDWGVNPRGACPVCSREMGATEARP